MFSLSYCLCWQWWSLASAPCTARLTRKQLQRQVSLNMELRLARLGSHLFDLVWQILTVFQILLPSASFSIVRFLHGEHSCRILYREVHHDTSIGKRFISLSRSWQSMVHLSLADEANYLLLSVSNLRARICNVGFSIDGILDFIDSAPYGLLCSTHLVPFYIVPVWWRRLDFGEFGSEGCTMVLAGFLQAFQAEKCGLVLDSNGIHRACLFRTRC